MSYLPMYQSQNCAECVQTVSLLEPGILSPAYQTALSGILRNSIAPMYRLDGQTSEASHLSLIAEVDQANRLTSGNYSLPIQIEVHPIAAEDTVVSKIASGLKTTEIMGDKRVPLSFSFM